MSGDIVIIGGGLAGLTAANRAAELGLNPIVLEQGGDPQYFCNSRFAGGLLHVAFKDMTASPDDIVAAVEAAIDGDAATMNGAVMGREGGRALAWLRAEGARFIKGGSLEFMRWVLAPPRPRGAGLDWKGRGPDVLLRKLTANLAERGTTVRLNSRARELIVEDGRIAGIIVDDTRIDAGAVVIADGGFQANMDLMRRFISPQPERLLQRGAATGRGDGLLMAEAAGAKLVGMGRFYGHLLGREAFQNDKLWPYPIIDPIAASSIVVNEAGQRFLDEGMGGVHMANEVAKLDDPLTATVIFDDAVWNGLAADNRYPPCMNPVFVKAGGTVLEAGDLASLAQAAGLSAEGLAKTVADHNAAIEGSGGGWSPSRTTNRFKPQPIATPPFRAIPICAGITYTMGGVAIDGDSRVQHRDDGVIPGLFAAGSASGGMEGGANAAYLGGLAKAVITGLRAAEAAAGENKAAA
ncbi:MAG: FAD-dependent oxidoreductase [Alphaproteobacteria bacterium]|nr:FAD-dependent oxidoreductase [Alphaproteobacteria bacterium]